GRERAEQDAAEYEAAAVDAALEAKEAWLLRSGRGAAVVELVDVARLTGELRAERAEIAEARQAAAQALEALDAAAEELRVTNGWSTYDTFFDGGMIASMAKHDRLDRAADRLRHADAALTHLGVELGDLGERGVAGVGIDGLTRTLDVWFDNVFTDLSVRSRIADARDRVDAARRQRVLLG
ncbi:hypothetical protein, partial [Isoptericola variabilis]|uniref:hypothetical protein n=1 Tax=Isoptericola variabilis TaxID=139208 RepID=UPI001C9571E5